MIIDSVCHLDDYKNFPRLYRALQRLQKISAENLPEKGEILEEGKLFFTPVTLRSKPESDCTFEAHRRYIDLHYIISGRERIALSDKSALTVKETYSEEKDIEFLQGDSYTHCVLSAGQFLLCYPHDAHKVAIMVDEPEDIQKIVFKIAY